MTDGNYARLERERRTSADLRRQLDQAWERINGLGEIIRSAGLSVGDLDSHLDLIAATATNNFRAAGTANTYRQLVVGLVHGAEDEVGAGVPAEKVLADLTASLLRLNARWKSDVSLASAREYVREVREVAASELSLFDA